MIKIITDTLFNLVKYAIEKNLIDDEDKFYALNKLLHIFKLENIDDINNHNEHCGDSLETMLNHCCDYAFSKGIISSNSTIARDLLDTEIMGVFCDLPSCITKKFNTLYNISPIEATNWFYTYCKDINYIREYRIKKDLKWIYKSEYGDIDITVNLSKPEKDPKMIAQLKNMPQSDYPKCQLCPENVGYAGRLNHNARQNLRIIPIKLCGENWSFQYSPYVYYNEHCIVLQNEHTPMKIDENIFAKLFDFLNLFPHYFIGSNAGLPIVGGSILNHNHFQGGKYVFAMEKAVIEKEYHIDGYDDLTIGKVKWPMAVIRINGKNPQHICTLAKQILKNWNEYSDEKCLIKASSNGEQHNAITPIARVKNGNFELDLVLRNNLTSHERPFGIFHPREEYHHIKKENIGLIEVMGLAVLPSRLKSEIEEIKITLLNNLTIKNESNIFKHKAWIADIKEKYHYITEKNIDDILKNEIGFIFVKVLEDASVFKRDENGIIGFDKFMEQI